MGGVTFFCSGRPRELHCVNELPLKSYTPNELQALLAPLTLRLKFILLMPLDHFIPQVHLKKFSFSDPPERINAIRKRDMFAFKPRAKDICRIDQGNTNRYLKEPRFIEAFLKSIEPNYTRAVEGLRTDKITPDCIFVIAGFVAYVTACSPTAMRLECTPLSSVLNEVTRFLDAAGRFPPPPLSIGGLSMTDLLEGGMVNIEVDRKFPQAMGIRAIYDLLFLMGNFDWDVMENRFHAESPFFTSDFPIGIVPSAELPTLDKIIPLSPDLAVRLRPNKQSLIRKVRNDFAGFRYRRVHLNHDEVTQINELIARCAETEVYFKKDKHDVSEVIRSNAGFRIETSVKSLRFGKGVVQHSTQIVTDKWQKAEPEK
jgi:hypothetical protein